MQDPMPIEIHLPLLSDAAVVAIHDSLYAILDGFEAHYFAQLHRYYAQRPVDNDVPPELCGDDPPF